MKSKSRLRIGIHNYNFIFEEQEKNFHGYNYAFFCKYVDIVYVRTVKETIKLKYYLMKKGINKRVVIGCSKLNRGADVLVSFAGVPYYEQHRPLKDFKGLKIYHTLDFSNNPSLSNELFREAGVDYVMAHGEVDKYSPLFQELYKDYIGKVIVVPFGYGSRFICKKNFYDRNMKAVAVGSIYPVKNNPYIHGGEMDEFEKFFEEEKWSHPLRREIVENREQWQDCIESFLPIFPDCRNEAYDAVQTLNDYTMYINSESLDNFPPARTYEAMACGCVMIANDKPIYRDLGFVDGENCILFKSGDYEEMIKKIRYYMNHKEELYQLHNNTLMLAEKYSHERVAEGLYEQIINKYRKRLEGL